MATFILFRIITFFGIVSMILSGISFFLEFKDVRISFDYIKTGNGVKTYGSGAVWFKNIAIVFCGVASVLLFVYEIFLLFNPKKFKFYEYGLIRILGYLYIGISVLGISGDLGISASAIALFAGLLNIVVIIGLYFTCITMNPIEANSAAPVTA